MVFQACLIPIIFLLSEEIMLDLMMNLMMKKKKKPRISNLTLILISQILLAIIIYPYSFEFNDSNWYNTITNFLEIYVIIYEALLANLFYLIAKRDKFVEKEKIVLIIHYAISIISIFFLIIARQHTFFTFSAIVSFLRHVLYLLAIFVLYMSFHFLRT